MYKNPSLIKTKRRILMNDIEYTLHFASTVNQFNSQFSDCRDNFLYGNCYWYARILQERFRPWFNTTLMYNPIDNHFCCRFNTKVGVFYVDASGIAASGSDEWQTWAQYIHTEPLGAARIYRDCIWHLTEDQWNNLPSDFKNSPWNFDTTSILSELNCIQLNSQP